MMRTVLFLAMTSCSALADFPLGGSSGDNQPAVASLVSTMLSSYHYAGHPIDDAVAEQWMQSYLQGLDFNRMFFLASDVEEFRAKADTIDDDLRASRPKLTLAREIYARFQLRVQERVETANTLLDNPIDLTNDEDYIFDRSKAEWPATLEEMNELWRQRIEEQMILGALQKKEEADSREMLKKRYHRLAGDVASAEGMDVLERYLTALTTVYDPHTIYFKPASQDNFDIEMANSLEGIGASLRTVGEYTVVMDLIAGGPAEKDGTLQPGDKIIAVGQADGEPSDVIDLRIDKVVKQIRGKKGTEVRLTVIPSDATDPSETRVIPITREKVVLADSDADVEVHEVDGKKLAVINIPSFYFDPRGGRSASRDLKRILTKDMGEGIDGVVLDLRENGGGSLQEAVRMTGLFIKRGAVVQIRERDGEVESLDDDNPSIAWDGPLVVLTSPLSASASEIVAGAIQDYGRGLVVGSESTHGKGTVQTVIDLSEVMGRMSRTREPAGALKLTTQKFYRVNGESTQVKGVAADVVIPSPWDGLDIYEGDLEHALPWDTIDPVSHARLGDFGTILPGLQQKSAGRVASEPLFQKMAESQKERMRLKEEKVVSLNLEKRLAENKVEPADPEDKKKEDPVLDEALAVMVDFIGIG